MVVLCSLFASDGYSSESSSDSEDSSLSESESESESEQNSEFKHRKSNSVFKQIQEEYDHLCNKLPVATETNPVPVIHPLKLKFRDEWCRLNPPRPNPALEKFIDEKRKYEVMLLFV